MDPAENINLTFWIKNLTDNSYVVNNIPFGPGFGQITLIIMEHPELLDLMLDINFNF